VSYLRVRRIGRIVAVEAYTSGHISCDGLSIGTALRCVMNGGNGHLGHGRYGRVESTGSQMTLSGRTSLR
jgi:hypothetical protein